MTGDHDLFVLFEQASHIGRIGGVAVGRSMSRPAMAAKIRESASVLSSSLKKRQHSFPDIAVGAQARAAAECRPARSRPPPRRDRPPYSLCAPCHASRPVVKSLAAGPPNTDRASRVLRSFRDRSLAVALLRNRSISEFCNGRCGRCRTGSILRRKHALPR